MSQRTDRAVNALLERARSSKSSVMGCTVRRLTEVGAHLQVPADFAVPETFNMTFDGGRSVRPCRLVWRSFNEMAVEFL